MYTCQCEECQMRQSSGILLKEVAAFGRCPLIEVSLAVYDITTHAHLYT